MLRIAKASQFANLNQTFPAGDILLEEDTGLTKLPDGATAFNSLFYVPIFGPEWGPQDSGWLAWSNDPADNFTGFQLFNGVVSVTAVKIPCDMTVTNIIYDVQTVGATMTSGQCFVGLYQGGSLKAASATQHTNFTVLGTHVAALTSAQTVTRGYAVVAFLPNGTTAPKIGCSIGNSSGSMASGSTLAWPTFNSLARSGFKTTGSQTVLPSTLGAVTAGASCTAVLS